MKNALIEGTVASLCQRRWETYYLKAEREVDIVLVKGRRFLPIEIKHSSLLRPNDLKQISKYSQGLVAHLTESVGQSGKLVTLPIPLLSLLVS